MPIFWRVSVRLIAVLCLASPIVGQEASTKAVPSIGPETEKRFPPLTMPEGFNATLFACDPLVEYPSVIALGPRQGTLFVAHDYVTGLGIEIVRRDEVRLLEDTDHDGYADRSTVFAGDFNSIQGLAFDDGTVFVMHAPLLTSLKDIDGNGTADERRDLISGLGLKPEDNPNRLHCANGVTASHDGWLYLSLGDRGCNVERPEGDRLVFQQGGILRCRHDGSDLHVFSSGLRNIYDVALDDELNVFVRDNENDGGDYMIRVNHCFFGSDHGYPYHYYERPNELLKPLADLGRGSSAGGTSYLETRFPRAYQSSLYFCEWGRAVVRYEKTRASSSFAPMQEIDFAAGAATDPYGFKPTDLIVDRDGSLLISDWCDGQRPKRGRGRIYRVSYVGENSDTKTSAVPNPGEENLNGVLRRLGSASYHERLAAQLSLQKSPRAVRFLTAQIDELNTLGRMHAVWIFAQSNDESAAGRLFEIASTDNDPRVRVQAVRAIGDLQDPILVQNKIKAGPGDPTIAERVARLAAGNEPRVVLEVLIVLGRLSWQAAPDWIGKTELPSDPAIDHAIAHVLRQSQNWEAVLKLLDASPRLRTAALHAIAEQRDSYLAAELIDRLKNDPNPKHRADYAEWLARIVRKLEPWTYWGFRPAPRMAATVDWEQTAAIEGVLNRALADTDHGVRARSLSNMRREGAKIELPRLANWLPEEPSEAHGTLILETLIAADMTEALPILKHAVLLKEVSTANRIRAWQAFAKNIKPVDETLLVALAQELEDGDVLAAAFHEFGNRSHLDVNGLLQARLYDAPANVRAESIRALGKRRATSAAEHVRPLLMQPDDAIRLAAAEAAGLLKADDCVELLLALAGGNDRALARAGLQALQQLKSGRAVAAAVAAIKFPETQIVSLRYLAEFGSAKLSDAVVESAKHQPAVDVQTEALRLFATWADRSPEAGEKLTESIAQVQGHSGVPTFWKVLGPIPDAEAVEPREQLQKRTSSPPLDLAGFKGQTLVADSQALNGEMRLTRAANSDAANGVSVWLAWTVVSVDVESPVELFGSADGSFSISINGQQIHQRAESAGFRQDSDRVQTTLGPGMNSILIEIRSTEKEPQFHVRFRRLSSAAEHERLIQFALTGKGNIERGREVFANAEKSSCIRCHRLGKEGGQIGPDLTGIGSRFSRIHLIESILQPNRSMAQSYQTIVVVLQNGRSVSGIKISENAETLSLGDNQGKIHEIVKTEIDEIARQVISTMPEGLEKKLTDTEFIDLMSYLESQKASGK